MLLIASDIQFRNLINLGTEPDHLTLKSFHLLREKNIRNPIAIFQKCQKSNRFDLHYTPTID